MNVCGPMNGPVFCGAGTPILAMSTSLPLNQNKSLWNLLAGSKRIIMLCLPKVH